MKKPIRIAINGFGRIGRCVFRSLYESQNEFNLQIVAINELADCKTIAHLCKYDSTHGRFSKEIKVVDDCLSIDNQDIQILHHDNLDDLPWESLSVDIVMECTGEYSDREAAEKHLKAGAKKVLLSQPGKSQSDVDATIVYGYNHHKLIKSDKIISNASCSTNCIIPVIQTLEESFGIESGVITTIHSAMNDQPVIDAYHHTDLRKTRSAMHSIIPVDTGLAQGIDRLFPELKGKFEAQAMRVPTINVSAIDLSVVVKEDVSVSLINFALETASDNAYEGILGYSQEMLASCDFNHDARSGIVDGLQTRVAGNRLVKILVWFDNEWGFSNRMLDVATEMAAFIEQ
ncbi:MAG: type I glyceraldehyde-3-phosphate dehydrogenase [Cellvibrionaceae bacterium]